MSVELLAGSRVTTYDPRPWQEMVDAMNQAGVYVGHGLTLPEHGPWDDEPDDIQWTDESTGYACWMKRGPTGGWNGYVGVPRSHPWWGVDYGYLEDDPLASEYLVNGHWGLTFAGSWLAEGDWWFGFDCGHAFDIVPGMPAFPGATYKDVGYVQRQITLLASQLRLRARIDL